MKDVDTLKTYEFDEATLTNKSRKNSVGVSSVRMSEHRREARGGMSEVKRAAVAFILAVSMATSLGLGAMVVDAKDKGYVPPIDFSISEYSSISTEEIEKMIDHSIASNNIHYNQDGSYWYDYDGMAKNVIDSDDPEIALFSLYSDLREKYQPMTAMNRVFTSANDVLKFTEADSYVRYLESLHGIYGVAYGTGVSYDDYMKYIGKHISEKNNINDMVNQSIKDQDNQTNLNQSTK